MLEVILEALEKLSKFKIVKGTVTANWNTATGTSGETGEDLASIGDTDIKYRLHSFMVDTTACTANAIVTIKMFIKVNGTERKCFSQNYLVEAQTNGSQPGAQWIVTGELAISNVLRVEVYSDTSESVALPYEGILQYM